MGQNWWVFKGVTLYNPKFFAPVLLKIFELPPQLPVVLKIACYIFINPIFFSLWHSLYAECLLSTWDFLEHRKFKVNIWRKMKNNMSWDLFGIFHTRAMMHINVDQSYLNYILWDVFCTGTSIVWLLLLRGVNHVLAHCKCILTFKSCECVSTRLIWSGSIRCESITCTESFII